MNKRNQAKQETSAVGGRGMGEELVAVLTLVVKSFSAFCSKKVVELDSVMGCPY